jgi:hypothetical protein
MPRSDGEHDPPDDMTSVVPPMPGDGSATRDTGAVQLLILLGWIPTGVAAIISGVFVGLQTGDVGRALVVIVGGTLVGWIAMLVLVFTVGNVLEQNGLLGRAPVFEGISVVLGVLATIAFAAQAL